MAKLINVLGWVFCFLGFYPVCAEVITLTGDIEHVGAGSPFKKTTKDTLVITSTLKKAVIISEGSTWDLSGHSVIEFTGNARLVCTSGSHLKGNSGVLRFKDEARLVVGKE